MDKYLEILAIKLSCEVLALVKFLGERFDFVWWGRGDVEEDKKVGEEKCIFLDHQI